MCGICGAIWSEESRSISEEQLKQMTDTLSHRGPDARGLHWEQNSILGVGLGHRRLSIIDLAAGQQPMWNEDHSVCVVFNGEIYNYRELQKDLKAKGHQFTTDCDTEVLVHLYEDYGREMVHHLRGMFAFAIWDRKHFSMLLARDRFGQKPLIYRQEESRLLFASEMKAILQIPGIPREVDPNALDLFLTWQYVPAPWSMLKGFQKLLPGHTAVWQENRLDIQQYWTPTSIRGTDSANEQTRRDTRNLSYAQTQEKLKETLTEAVRLRLRSDVPLGAFLSGGIDSTLITGLMQKELDRPVETFSIGFDIAHFDERSFARMAAKSLGTNHHEKIVAPSAVESLPELVWHYEEPYADSSAIPTMALCEFTREAVKVALTGDGGDELFIGYDRYRAAGLGARIDRLPGPLRSILKSSHWQKMPASLKQKSFSRRLKRFLTTAALSPEQRYMTWISYFDAAHRNDIYSSGFREKISGFHSEEWMTELYEQTAENDFVSRTAAVDQISYLPNDILTKVDIASMAYGLECRSPFLDHQVADLATSMPLNYKLKGRYGKQILRDTFADLIPEPILQRSKMGFGVPVDHWFRNELKPLLHDVLLSERAMHRGYFEPAKIQRLVEEHTTGLCDHSKHLWAMLVLEVWCRMFIDTSEVSATRPTNNGVF